MNPQSDIPKDADWELISRYVTGCSTSIEREAVEARMEKDPEFAGKVGKAQETWRAAGKLDIGKGADRAWFLLSRRIRKKESLARMPEAAGRKTRKKFRPGNRRLWFIRVAVMLVMAGGAAAAWWLMDQPGREVVAEEAGTAAEMREVAASRGQRIRVQLSDGSRVVLNADSRIRFPRQFEADVREVELEGEAYFEVETLVSEGGTVPFTVRAGDVWVEVLGTEFNVNAYKDRNQVDVIVAGGRVAVDVAGKNTGSRVLLEKGEKIFVPENGVPSSPEAANLNETLGWLDDHLIFRGVPLGDVMKTLNRYYDVNIVLDDSDLAGQRIMVEFKKETLTRVLEVLTTSFDLHAEKREDKILLKKTNK